MITIRDLKIELPEELAHRSQHIIQLVEEGCRNLRWGGGVPAELKLSDVVFSADADDAWIAGRIVSGLRQHAVKGR